MLGYALAVEAMTIKKKANLILNVDGAIAAAFVDMLRGCKAFTKEEGDELVRHGCLNGLFVLARSIGIIGHVLDQKRLAQDLYRHPWQDIAYIDDMPTNDDNRGSPSVGDPQKSIAGNVSTYSLGDMGGPGGARSTIQSSTMGSPGPIAGGMGGPGSTMKPTASMSSSSSSLRP